MYEISGFPKRLTIFLFLIPFDPPLAGINATIWVEARSAGILVPVVGAGHVRPLDDNFRGDSQVNGRLLPHVRHLFHGPAERVGVHLPD